MLRRCVLARLARCDVDADAEKLALAAMRIVHDLAAQRYPPDISIGENNAGFELQTFACDRDCVQCASHGLPFLRMDLLHERIKTERTFRRTAEQIATLPRCPHFSGRRIPSPDAQSDRFSRQAH